MTLLAGVDIGNSTTEIVIAQAGSGGSLPTPVSWDRRPTRGVKGSPEAAAGAARLLAAMERRLGETVDLVVLTPQRPVHTQAQGISRAAVETGVLRALPVGSRTTAGTGYAVGTPVDVAGSPPVGAGPVVLVARDPLGFRATAARLREWVAAGVEVVAVVLAGDEAALVGARSGGWGGPVADGVDAEAVLAGSAVAVEVAGHGRSLARLGDPVWLAGAFGLTEGDRWSAEAVAAGLAGSGVGVVVLDRTREARRGDGIPAGSAGAPEDADDVWEVDLDALDRPGAAPLASRDLCRATLLGGEGARAHPQTFEAAGRRVLVHGDGAGLEASAAVLGGRSTPGARTDAVVIDLGGGTIDAGWTDGAGVGLHRTGAGSGDLLSVAVERALGISRGAAEWVKRGPSWRVDAPLLGTDEDGGRRFLDAAAPGGAVGWLVTGGPGGPLPFSTGLAPGDWRALRLTLKRAVFADNLARLLGSVTEGGAQSGRDVILVGGPALDDELLLALAHVLQGSAVGRGDVAGVLGPRWAVAYGLAVSADAPA